MEEEQVHPASYVIGLDLSTQKLKGTVINAVTLDPVLQLSVDFDLDLPTFRTKAGVHSKPGNPGTVVTSPVKMWVQAIDLFFTKLKAESSLAPIPFKLSQVVAVSGAGQQHGSVYWKRGAQEKLKNLGAASKARDLASLSEALKDAFAIEDSPIWMDTSTSEYCRILERSVGGEERLAEITGSRGYERFTGNQIAKMVAERPQEMAECERISLVSSFLASVLLGDYAPIDFSDGSGMNLLDIKAKEWDKVLLDAVATAGPLPLHGSDGSERAAELRRKLGQATRSDAVLGKISGYFVEKYGLAESCEIVIFTGDNPSSLAGMNLETGDVVISLGTSDTLFLSLDIPAPKIQGHIFCNPIDPEGFMGLLCYQNGSLSREWGRDQFCEGKWSMLHDCLERTSPGLGGQIGFYFLVPEITPTVNEPMIRRFDENGSPLDRFEDAATEIRALVESHFLGLRAHAESMGLTIGSRVFVTGGASENKSLLQVLSDVFGVPAYHRPDSFGSASLGGCFRAIHAIRQKEKANESDPGPTFQSLFRGTHFSMAGTEPRREVHQIYTAMLPRFLELEKKIVAAATKTQKS